MKNMQRTISALILGLTLGMAVQAQRGYDRGQYEMLNEARLLLDAGQWSDAYRIYQRLVNIDTTFAETYYGMGMCELNIPEKRDQSIRRFEAASAARPPAPVGEHAAALRVVSARTSGRSLPCCARCA